MSRRTTRRQEAEPKVRVAVRRRSIPSHVIAAGLVTLILLILSAVARAEPRTLDTVTIEGEVRLPEVLFITSRDVARPMDWLDHYAGPTAAGVASLAPLCFDLYVLPAAPGIPGAVLPPPEPETAPGDPAGTPAPIHDPEVTRSTQEEVR
ncbi:MAG: hypothetical protein DHS20C21_24020 [Gemmatimonadota bacterium]|nr:MAG: hypothetical protein DHS20C21_24020 [Gemmatimonadota bacterium]